MVEYISAHWQDLYLIVSSVVFTASLVVKLTPTPKDDAVVAKLMAVIEKLALNKRA